MRIKKILIPVITVMTSIGGLLLLKRRPGSSSTAAKVMAEAVTEPEKVFAGIPLSKLSDLAKQCYHGISCTIDQWGFLVFNHKSNRGHKTLHAQMMIDEAGKLINLGGHYPGQWWSSADAFAELANKTLEFKK